jgi:hypothetical protein
VKSVSATYTDVDSKTKSSLKEVFNHYLHIENALFGDNATEAATGAKALSAALKTVDKSLFTNRSEKSV